MAEPLNQILQDSDPAKLRSSSTATSTKIRWEKFDRTPTKPRHFPSARRYWSSVPQDIAEPIKSVIRGDSPWPLLISGTAGIGKTMAALVVYDHCESQRNYTTLTDLQDRLIRLMRNDANNAGLWADWRSAKFAVLDEIGARGNPSEFHYEVLKKAIDLREDHPTIYVSNLKLDELSELYDDRIASRLGAGTVAWVEAEDIRLKSKASLKAAVGE